VHSVHSVAQATLPESADDWRACLFKFTRALKFDCRLELAGVAQVRRHVEHWYGEAAAAIPGVTFADVWGEVVTSWDKARHSAFGDPLSIALAKAQANPNVPPVPTLVGYDEPVVALAYQFLFWLAQSDDQRFFVSCRALGERLGIDHKKAWRLLRMFEADGEIVCLKRGKQPKASRYRWTGTMSGARRPR
jgi:hypothetical protein